MMELKFLLFHLCSFFYLSLTFPFFPFESCTDAQPFLSYFCCVTGQAGDPMVVGSEL